MSALLVDKFLISTETQIFKNQDGNLNPTLKSVLECTSLQGKNAITIKNTKMTMLSFRVEIACLINKQDIAAFAILNT